jgi:subtilisin family serine protease
MLKSKLNFILIGFVLILSSCDNSKTPESVFPAQVSSVACASSTIANRYIIQWEDGSYSVHHSDKNQDDEQFRNTYVKNNLSFIKHIDRDVKIRIKQETLTPQTAFQKNSAVSWGPEKIEAAALWNQGLRGQNILVGVVDGMVDSSQVQLAGNVISNQQFNQEQNDPSHNRHGTHVTGIIAADPTKGPIAGVAPAAKILVGQFIGNDGGGSLGDAIMAMNAVADKGAKVINMSWGGAPCVQNLRSALEDLSNRGILIVTASGNEGMNSDYSPTYPAAFGLLNQINVAASTIDDFLIYFSNRGYKTVNIVAPGVNIFSTVPGNQVETMDGTSMAAPMVTGAAALLWSYNPNATSQQIKSALLQSVDTPRDFTVSSHGRLNVRKAFDTLKSMLQSQ